jgi:hypothetical protein
MRTVKWNAFLSGLCGVAVVLGMMAASAHADVTTERGASILAFPKVLVDRTSSVITTDTIIQITNVSNSMVHARCYYVNAQLPNPDLPEGPFNRPLWQETDFTIWLTKQQPTHWQVSTGRFVDPTDSCFSGNQIDQTANNGRGCDGAGIDPGAVPPVPFDFIGELKCIEVDVSDNPIGGNHLKGEATIKTSGDVVKYNAIGIEGTELAGETGNTLPLDQPSDTDDPIGQYNACPNVLILNHLAEGATDPVILTNLHGGVCDTDSDQQCQSDEDCGEDGPCVNGPEVIVDGDISLRSATLTDLTLVPCTQDFENQIPGRVKIQFVITNEFEQQFSASTTVECWKNFFLHQVDARTNPNNSVFAFGTLGTTVAQTRIIPVSPDGGVIGVAGVTRADFESRLARVALNIHTEGDRFSATGGEVVDVITLSDR